MIGVLVMLLFFVGPVFVEGGDYQVGPGDVVEISVWRDDSLTRTVTIPPDGVVSFPLIGDFDASGKSVTDIRTIVTEKLREYVQDAAVNVTLLEINSMKAYVIGKVKKPGAFSVGMDTSVMQMLSMAGGLTPFASEKNIHILRTTGNDTLKIPFNYKEVLKGKNLQQNIPIQRGDVIVVP
jgi:polysaccharide export outer membrane protein